MNSPYVIPASAAPYILFPRTHYLRIAEALPLRALRNVIPALRDNLFVKLEAKLRASKVGAMYLRDMEAEYETLKDYLPQRCSTILDVGCGVAGIDVFLNRHYRQLDQRVDFLLLDKSQVEDRVYYMYKSNGAFYNSLETAKELLLENGVTAGNVTLIEANEQNSIHTDRTVDLALFLISWGYHYPVATYLTRVQELLSHGGRLILDVRKRTDGLDELARAFGGYEVSLETDKCLRVCAQKSDTP